MQDKIARARASVNIITPKPEVIGAPVGASANTHQTRENARVVGGLSDGVRVAQRLLALVVVLFVLAIVPAGAQTTNDHVRLAVSGDNLSNLALYLALDHGYFAQQHLDIEVVPFIGSAIGQLVPLARGDIDITTVPPAPGLFNLPAQGYNVKIVASLTEAHRDWNGASWLMVRQDLWDAKSIRKPADLRGKHLDIAAAGAPTDILGRETLRLAGLSSADVQYTSNIRTPPNWFATLRNHAVDVQAVVEPFATELQAEGLGHKWISYADSTPWFQDLYIAASPRFVADHSDALRRFLIALIRAEGDITRTGAHWNPTLIAEAAKWSKLPNATIEKTNSPSYVGQFGAINVSSLERSQGFWVDLDLVKTPEPMSTLVDATALNAARKESKIH